MRLRIAAAALAFAACAGILRADWTVQVAAYADPKHLEEAAQRLRGEGFPVVTERFTPPNGTPLIRLMVGPYRDRREADRVKISLEYAGFPGYVRAYQPPAAAPVPKPAATPAAPPAASAPKPIPTPVAPPAAAPRVAPAPATPAPAPAPALTPAPEEEPEPVLRVPAVEEAAPTEEPEPFVSLPGAEEGGSTTGVRLSGFFLGEGAYTYPDPSLWSKARATLDLGLDGKSGALGWKVSGRAFYDAVYDFEDDFYPERVRDEQQWEADFYETYLDISAGDFDIRLGRQHIIWGEVVGLFFADVVSAKQLFDFVARDFDLIRIPQWAARLEWTKGDFHAELIGIPWMSYDEIGEPGGDFYPTPVGIPPGFEVVILEEQKPARNPRNGAWGGRISYAGSGWDLGAFVYDTMDASPAFFRRVETEPVPTLIFEPGHDRIRQYGVTLAKDLSALVLRAEAVYTEDRLYPVLRLEEPDGVVPQDSLDGIVSLDWLPGESRVTLQLFEKWFPDHDPDILFEEFETGASISASTKLAGGKLEPEALYVRSFDEQGWMLRGRLSVWPSPSWRLGVGADVFGGPATGFFGRYGAKDRVYLESRVAF